MSLAEPYSYDDADFLFLTCKGNTSQFDLKLRKLWELKDSKNIVIHSYKDGKTKDLCGEYGFVAQLYEKRALRRKSSSVSSINMPFNPDNFHFGKIKNDELLFEIIPRHWQKEESKEEVTKHMLIVNNNPIGYCSSLLIPSLEKCYPQILSFEPLRLAIETMLISHDPNLRIGMNSLGGYASVNHLHFHVYVFEGNVYLQFAPAKQLIGDCYETLDFPAKSFVFQLVKKEDVLSVVESVTKLIKFLQNEEIAHNIYITRGVTLTDSPMKRNGTLNAVRIYVFARKSFFGIKPNSELTPAFCEFAGHIIIKDASTFEEVTEEAVVSVLADACNDIYMNIRERVIELYS